MTTTEGLNYLLNAALRGTTPISSWYMGLIASTGFTGLDKADVLGSHAGWTEDTHYSQATRPAWSPGAAANGSVLAAAVAFTINAAGVSLKGWFIASNSTKGGTSGTLLATGLFTAVQTPSNGEVQSVTNANTLTPVN